MEIVWVSEEGKLPKKVQREIETAILTRSTAKGMEIEAKEMTKRVKEILLPLLVAYEIKSCSLPGVGKVASKVNKGSALSEKKLREALLTEGMEATIINRIIKKSSTTWSTEYVDFVRAT